MGRYKQRCRKVPLWTIMYKPDNPTDYMKLDNQYWAVDDADNVFFIGLKPICGTSKRTVIFYIQNIRLPLIPYSRKHRHIIFLGKAWILKPIGRSRGRK